MRTSWLALVSVIACGASATLCVAAKPAVARVDAVVRLDSTDALEKLKISNPKHYAKAIKIIDAASQVCRIDSTWETIPVAHGLVAPAQAQAKGQPQGKKQPQQTASASCTWGMWMTSYPPKRELSFTLDHTMYIALVTVPMDTKLIPTMQELALHSAAP